MAGFTLPGTLCTVLKENVIDPGTMCKQKSNTPGSGGITPTQSEINERKYWYINYAYTVSYAMQGKSTLDSTSNKFSEILDKSADTLEDIKDFFGDTKPNKPHNSKARVVQSYLGGKFLRMYLDGKLDPDIVKQAGEEMATAPTFLNLQIAVNERLKRDIKRNHGKKLTTAEIGTYAGRYLTWKRKQKGGVAFKKTLNTVIGGVSGISVAPLAKIISDTPTTTGGAIVYQIDVTFRDSYDFENDRSGEYDRYRKKLALLLQQNKFDAFDIAYFGEAHASASTKHKTHLTDANLFASYMYALEKRGWTPGGLVWEVTIPMQGTLEYTK